jgi:signal transduction histidine kinase
VKLRMKLTLTLAITTVPVIAALAIGQHMLRKDVLDTMSLEYVSMHASPLDRAHCEASPVAFTAQSRSSDATQTIFAYDVDLQPTSGGRSIDDIAETVKRDGQAVSDYYEPSGQRMLRIIKKMPWDGPCAYLMSLREIPPKKRPGLKWLPYVVGALSPLAGVLAVVVALSPLVRRIRKLSAAVRATAARGEAVAIPVSGDDELDDLARTFDETASALRATLDEQARREQALREFLSATTHDLRVPLSVLLGQLADLRERFADDTHAGTEVSTAVEQAHHIASLARNLGAATKLDSAPAIERMRVDLRATVERCAARHRPLARARAISLEHGVPDNAVTVDADPTLVEQAVGNVIENAIRYGNPGGHVAVVLAQSAGGFTLDVLDDGPGIAADEVPTLMKRGARGLVGRESAPEGQGLGLSIAHEVAARHGWTMSLTPNEGGGLRVRFAA